MYEYFGAFVLRTFRRYQSPPHESSADNFVHKVLRIKKIFNIMADNLEKTVMAAAYQMCKLSAQSKKDDKQPSAPRSKAPRRRSSRRARQKFTKGQHLHWVKHSKSEVCTFYAAGSRRNLPKIKLANGEIKSVPKTELEHKNFRVGDAIQCRDTKSLDPENRTFWYEATVVQVNTRDDGMVQNYVVKPKNESGSSTVTVEEPNARSLEWRDLQPDAVSAGPEGPTKFQQDCACKGTE